ncbi:MAG: type III-A CRISPR-associated protein Csm2 [Clostridia bacterium]|jgi:CRISPR-associated protein Csm2|nr:type III-A CRISPR-associated protein Csm2 [Clostridia bacterium]MDD3972510.1 type III-A CRISPR-associated protein Csm2 [Clostridia bacterium]MDD4578318.1 type III-A CRISPR-associated protein Csm2 [Anaerolineaceae bacterium]
MSKWTDDFPKSEITGKITTKTVEFAKEFGSYLGTDVKNGYKIEVAKLTTNQLRKFFGEVKRQQMKGYNETDFVLLKPKLAYAVGRTKEKSKITDFYEIMSIAIDEVKSEAHFKNFIKIFEAIVAYHKAAEEKKLS